MKTVLASNSDGINLVLLKEGRADILVAFAYSDQESPPFLLSSVLSHGYDWQFTEYGKSLIENFKGKK